MTNTKLTQPLKWHGGKNAFQGKLANWVISLMPPHIHYVEPFFGGGAVLLNKDPKGVSEVVGDINSELTAFWLTLQHDGRFTEFQRYVEAVPFSQWEWNAASSHPCQWPEVEAAVRFFIRCRQSRAGRMKEFATLSRGRTRRGMNEQASAWLNAVEGLPAVHARLKRVVILTDDAVKVICQEDGPNTVFYLDPPYLHETRVTTTDYKHEMAPEQHEELLGCLADITGRFLLSGYRSEMYDNVAQANCWRRHEFEIVNNASAKKTKDVKTECVWTNFQLV